MSNTLACLFQYLLRLEPDGKNGRELQVLGVRFGQFDYPISCRTVPKKYIQYVCKCICNIYHEVV